MFSKDAINTYFSAIDAEIQDLLGYPQTTPDEYWKMLYYHMDWENYGQPDPKRGKRIRPLLTLLAAEAQSGKWQAALPFAAAVEILHNFSLVHDDIQDQSDKRRGRLCVYKIWGMPQAINAGDTLFTYAHAALRRAQIPAEDLVTAWQIFDDTCLALTRGQYLDMSFETRNQVSVPEYFEMIGGKTAALLGASAELGALAAGANAEQREHFREYGRHLGLAFQVRDDILGIWGDESVTGKSAATDIITRKMTLPVLYGMEQLPDFAAAYATETATVPDIVAMLEELKADEHSAEVEQHHSDLAMHHLAEIEKHHPAPELLKQLTAKLLNRAH